MERKLTEQELEKIEKEYQEDYILYNFDRQKENDGDTPLTPVTWMTVDFMVKEYGKKLMKDVIEFYSVLKKNFQKPLEEIAGIKYSAYIPQKYSEKREHISREYCSIYNMELITIIFVEAMKKLGIPRNEWIDYLWFDGEATPYRFLEYVREDECYGPREVSLITLDVKTKNGSKIPINWRSNLTLELGEVCHMKMGNEKVDAVFKDKVVHGRYQLDTYPENIELFSTELAKLITEA